MWLFPVLAAGLNKPRLSLDGMFKVVPKTETYSEGVIVSIIPYGVLAYGSYGSCNKFESFFIYGTSSWAWICNDWRRQTWFRVSLHYPSVCWWYDNRYRYNSHTAYPTVGDVLSFPLVKGFEDRSVIQDAENSQNVFSILTTFDLWVHTQPNSLWFAAGLKVTAFKSLHVCAVAILEVDPDVSVGLFARVDFDFPEPLFRACGDWNCMSPHR